MEENKNEECAPRGDLGGAQGPFQGSWRNWNHRSSFQCTHDGVWELLCSPATRSSIDHHLGERLKLWVETRIRNHLFITYDTVRNGD